MVEDKDKGYRLIFSFPIMVEQLIRRFVGGRWIDRLDFESLQKVSERDISQELLRREKDLLWRLKWRRADGEPAGWFYVYLHFEFQSTPERFMALRSLTYKALCYEDLVRGNKLTSSGRLPPVLSIVIYNGKEPWRAPLALDELIEPIPDLEPEEVPEGFTFGSYQLIDENRYSDEELQAQDPVSALFYIERSRNLEDVGVRVARFGRTIERKKYQRLIEAVIRYAQQGILHAIAPGMELPDIHDLLGVETMLKQSAIEWRDSWIAEGVQKGRREGRREGRQKGREEGRQEGEARVLRLLLEQRFGRLPETVLERLDSAGSEQIMNWTRRFGEGGSMDEIFDDRKRA